MSRFKIIAPVFTRDQSAVKRGINAEEMILCPVCKGQSGAFILRARSIEVIGFNSEGKRFDWLNWDRVKCINCNHSWEDKYGVSIGKTN